MMFSLPHCPIAASIALRTPSSVATLASSGSAWPPSGRMVSTLRLAPAASTSTTSTRAPSSARWRRRCRRLRRSRSLLDLSVASAKYDTHGRADLGDPAGRLERAGALIDAELDDRVAALVGDVHA